MNVIEEHPQTLVHRIIVPEDDQKALKEYFLSKQRKGDIVKYPEWDKPRVNPASELIKSRRELTTADAELKAKRDEQKIRRRHMDEQWDEMRRKEELLRQSFIKFSKFVDENQEKRERAETKIAEEKERQLKREEEANELSEKLEKMTEIRDRMQKYVQEYKMYQVFLEKIVNEMDEYHSISDIFNRYETLIEVRLNLSEAQDESLRILEVTGNQMQQMTEEKSYILTDLNNQLALLQSRYEKAKIQALHWETIVSRIKAASAKKNLELTEVKFATWNLYRQICARKNVPVEIPKNDIEQQLVYIKRTILELKRIVKSAKKQAAIVDTTKAPKKGYDTSISK